MIRGTVNSDREAVLRLILHGADGRHECDTIIDTGYNGWLTLPSDIIESLGLPWKRSGRAVLADGSESIFNIYEGIILWDGQPITIPIDEMDATPLVGMSLMYGFELVLPVVDGGAFTLRILNDSQ